MSVSANPTASDILDQLLLFTSLTKIRAYVAKAVRRPRVTVSRSHGITFDPRRGFEFAVFGGCGRIKSETIVLGISMYDRHAESLDVTMCF